MEPETGIITDVELTPANAGDGPIGVALLDDETEAGGSVRRLRLRVRPGARRSCRAGPHRGDQAVADRPQPLPRRRPVRRDDFRIDYTARTVTCPNGITVTIAAKAPPPSGRAATAVPLRSRCTANTTAGRSTSANTTSCSPPPAPTGVPGSASMTTGSGGPLVERSIAWLVANGHRRVRYRGVERNRLGLSVRAAAINLRRLLNLGLTHTTNGWASPPDQRVRGRQRGNDTFGDQPSSAADSHPHIDSSVRRSPDPPSRYDPPPANERGTLLSTLLGVRGRCAA